MIDLAKYEGWDDETIQTTDRFVAENDKIGMFFRDLNQRGLNDRAIWNYGLWLKHAKINLRKKFLLLQYKNDSKFIIDAKDNIRVYVDRNDKEQDRENFYSQLNVDIWISTTIKLCEPEIFFSEENSLRN